MSPGKFGCLRLYPSIDAAEEAVQKLGGQHLFQQVSIIAKGPRRREEGPRVRHLLRRGEVGGAFQGRVGRIFGLLVGAAVIQVPGVGVLIVAGSLATALMGGSGAVAGATLAGMLGWLTSLPGISASVSTRKASRPASPWWWRGTVDEVAKAHAILAATSPAAANSTVSPRPDAHALGDASHDIRCRGCEGGVQCSAS